MQNNSFVKTAMGVWLFTLLILVFSCIPEEKEIESDVFSYPDQVDFLPLSAVFDGTDFSARKACDYMGCGETTEVCLVAGRNIEVGKVEIYNDEKYVYVTAHTTGDWYIIETHLKTAATKSGLGQGSNPAPGRFPYKTNHNPAVQKFTYMIPISDAGASFYTAFHASVVKIGQSGRVLQGETAWACGESFVARGNWATFTGLYTVYECDKEPEMNLCWEEETAWSYGNCYNRERGNWASFTGYNGEYKKAKLMAGKLYEIGEVIFEPAGNEVKITINLFETGAFQDKNENVKIQGYDVKPSGNPAPGQFTTHKGKATGKTYSVTVPKSKYYGVHIDAARSVACAL